MKLDDIGFYTLSEKRAENVSWSSDLQRCELILTNRCNFNCLYCRGIKKELQGDITFKHAKEIIDIWTSGNLHNVRFSGGEPTMWDDLIELVKYTKSNNCIEHIALSTNGSSSLEHYFDLMAAGVNDFSISLDACCSATANIMAGIDAKFIHISNVIKELSKKTYVTVGIVLNEKNNSELNNIIDYATKLGVSDIRIIPSAQSNHNLNVRVESDYKILNYRLDRTRNIRGMNKGDSAKCHLVKDDMVILNGKHFPCVIYMREQGDYIGDVYGKSLNEIRNERKCWFEKTNTFNNRICRKNCLDVCIAHNNVVSKYGV